MPRAQLVLVAPPYANNALHIAHLRSTYVPADVYARHARMCGRAVELVGGSDEYGVPVVMEAERSGRSPREVVDTYHASHLEDFERLGMSFDLFSRTTSGRHPEVVRRFYEASRAAGRLDRRLVETFRCEPCGISLSDRYLVAVCGHCGSAADGDHCNCCGRHLELHELRDPRCSRCGAVPVTAREEHLFYRLSDVRDEILRDVLGKRGISERIRAAASAVPRFSDWDITRSYSWGIPIPDLPGMTFYMIFEAFPNYVTFTEDLAHQRGRPELAREIWREDGDWEHVYFMGRDLVFLHYSIWQLMLRATRLRRPDVLSGGGLLNYRGQKMSKSSGWMITVKDALRAVDADVLRYYLLRFAPLEDDAEFDWKQLEALGTGELAALGDHVAAILASATPGGRAHLSDLGAVFEAVGGDLDALRFDDALRRIVALYAAAATQPAAPARASALAASLPVLLAPFVPATAGRLWRALGLNGAPDQQRFAPVFPRDGELRGAPDVRAAFPRIDPGALLALQASLPDVAFASRTCFLAAQATSMQTRSPP